MPDLALLTADPAAGGHDPATLTLARKAYRTLEPIHTLVYFAREGGEIYAELGITGGMRPYFASRSAALGVVPPEVVIATFYNFAPWTIRKAIPSVWEAAAPDQVIAARLRVVDTAMRRILGTEVLESPEMKEAADLAFAAAQVVQSDVTGRPLFAGHAGLAWPDEPHLRLWHAQTLFREHRGDGHVAALLLAGLDGCEALVSYVPLGQGLPLDILRATRGWSDEEWAAAGERLRDRGLLDADGNHTAAGRAQREQIEALTDRAAAAPWAELGAERTTRLRELVRPWSKAITADVFGGAA
jgi:hypothetical protein